MTITIYTTAVCPKCRRLKEFLNVMAIQYDMKDMQSPEGLTELRFNGVFALDAPVLQIGSKFLTADQLFKGIELQKVFLMSCITDGINKGDL
jgi:glutaredoxin